MNTLNRQPRSRTFRRRRPNARRGLIRHRKTIHQTSNLTFRTSGMRPHHNGRLYYLNNSRATPLCRGPLHLDDRRYPNNNNNSITILHHRRTLPRHLFRKSTLRHITTNGGVRKNISINTIINARKGKNWVVNVPNNSTIFFPPLQRQIPQGRHTRGRLLKCIMGNH